MEISNPTLEVLTNLESLNKSEASIKIQTESLLRIQSDLQNQAIQSQAVTNESSQRGHLLSTMARNLKMV